MRGETASRVRVRVRKPMKSYWRRFVVYWSKVVGLMVHPVLLRSCVRLRGAALRGSCRAVSGQSPSADIATRSSGFIVQALVCACGQLSSCDSFSEAQADGTDELGLPRSAVSARGVSTLFRGGTGAHHATASLSAGGTAVVVGSRPQLRSPAGAADWYYPDNVETH